MLSVMPWAVGRFYRPTVDENRSNNEKVIHKTKSVQKKYLRFEISEYVPNSHSHSHWNDENCKKHKTRDSYLFKTSKIIKIGWITKKLWWFQKPLFLFKKKKKVLIFSLSFLQNIFLEISITKSRFKKSNICFSCVFLEKQKI